MVKQKKPAIDDRKLQIVDDDIFPISLIMVGSVNPCRYCAFVLLSISSLIYSLYSHVSAIGSTSRELDLLEQQLNVLNNNHETKNGLRSSKNHMLSLKPLEHSLHSKWKLWQEMSSEEQDAALEEAGSYLTKYGKMISRKERGKIKHGECEFVEFKNGHALCGPRPTTANNCTFFSFGINDDPSFDIQLGEEWKCRGFAGDPTVQHPSKLHPRVTFHSVGASMLSENEERKIDKGGTEDWWTTSMPKLRFWLGVEHISIVKLDCEGCEFALARDILREDPHFLYHVDQISIETHVSRTWLNTREELYYFALQFALLEEAGFRLEWSDIFGCSKRHEVEGCLPDLKRFGFPCGYKPWPGKNNVVLGRSCQDFLWKRYPKGEEQ